VTAGSEPGEASPAIRWRQTFFFDLAVASSANGARAEADSGARLSAA